MPTYQPVYFYPDKMPIDISYLFENEKPAGKHGFCKVQGNRFVFEDGTPARFRGVIFNGACCFPEHDYAEKVSGRLAQAGCNIVRFHQLDAEWATPNIYRLTTGKWLRITRDLCEESFERMDFHPALRLGIRHEAADAGNDLRQPFLHAGAGKGSRGLH